MQTDRGIYHKRVYRYFAVSNAPALSSFARNAFVIVLPPYCSARLLSQTRQKRKPEIMPPTYQREAHWLASSTSILLHPLAIQAVGAADGADTVAGLIQCAGLHVKPRFPAVGVVHAAVGALEFGGGADAGGNIGIIADGATAVAVLLPAACTVECPPFKFCTVKGQALHVVRTLLHIVQQVKSVQRDGLVPRAAIVAGVEFGADGISECGIIDGLFHGFVLLFCDGVTRSCVVYIVTRSCVDVNGFAHILVLKIVHV